LTFSFFLLSGDTNRDRSVGFADLVALAQNYNTPGNKTWAQGDFNGDGSVDFADLVILAQHYGTTLPAPATPSRRRPRRQPSADNPPPPLHCDVGGWMVSNAGAF
jgi:hypothetical protein